ncbi:MAG TPA: NADH-quinone oxidoreductase subunit A [Gemmataceae bacterium]|jgi:NADH-quinone oxidoreductase subunit A
MTPLAAYLLLFVAVGIGFIFVHLMAGKLIRPNRPDPAKGTIYECGEPTIGSAWIQFDLRFYVVALLFVIFDVEVAFFFPWAVVFGKANDVAAVGQPTSPERYHQIADRAEVLLPPEMARQRQTQLGQMRDVTKEQLARMHELREKKEQLDSGVPKKQLPKAEGDELTHLEKVERDAALTVTQARSLGWLGFVEILVFFGVLLVGFAYLWSRGDLAWVRSLAAERSSAEPAPLTPTPTPAPARQPVHGPLAGTGAPG